MSSSREPAWVAARVCPRNVLEVLSDLLQIRVRRHVVVMVSRVQVMVGGASRLLEMLLSRLPGRHTPRCCSLHCYLFGPPCLDGPVSVIPHDPACLLDHEGTGPCA